MSVFLTTHNLAEAERLCQLVGIIRQGQLLTVGSPDELRAKQGTPSVEILGRGFSVDVAATLRARPEVVSVEQQDHRLVIQVRGSVATAPLVGLVVGAGAQVEEVRRGNATLENAFLTLMEDAKCQLT